MPSIKPKPAMSGEVPITGQSTHTGMGRCSSRSCLGNLDVSPRAGRKMTCRHHTPSSHAGSICEVGASILHLALQMPDAPPSIRRGASGCWLRACKDAVAEARRREPPRDLGSSRTAPPLVFPMLPLGMPWHLAWQRLLCEDHQDRGPHVADAQHGRLDRHQL